MVQGKESTELKAPATNSLCPWASYFPSLCFDFCSSKVGLIIPALPLPQLCYRGLKRAWVVSRWDSVKSAVVSTVARGGGSEFRNLGFGHTFLPSEEGRIFKGHI